MSNSLGTFEARSTFDLQPTLTDESGTAIDVSGATVTGFAEQDGAIYLNDESVATGNDTVTATNGGAKWSLTSTVSAKLPAGRVDLTFKVVVGSTINRLRAFIVIVRGTDA